MIKQRHRTQTADQLDYQGMQLVTDTQDLTSVIECLGLSAHAEEITGAIVHVHDGDYAEVWFTEDSAPWDNSATYHTPAYYGYREKRQ